MYNLPTCTASTPGTTVHVDKTALTDPRSTPIVLLLSTPTDAAIMATPAWRTRFTNHCALMAMVITTKITDCFRIVARLAKSLTTTANVALVATEWKVNR